MTVVSFIQPPQAEVIEKILRHCGLWQDRTSRAPPDVDGLVQDLDFGFSTPQNSPRQSNQAQDVSYQDIDTFLASFCGGEQQGGKACAKGDVQSWTCGMGA